MKGYEFERALVDVIIEISLKKGLKAKPLAEMAWPHRKDAGTKWRKIRNGDPPRELSVRDAYDLACAMGISITDLCGVAQTKILGTRIAPQPVQEKKVQEETISSGLPTVESVERSSSYKN